MTLLSACNTRQPLSQESSLDPFVHPNDDFLIYRQQVHDYLNANSLPHRTDDQIALNLPFEIPANTESRYRGKFLLIHGLNDSAYVWTDLATEIAALGFDVRAILLPGHGSKPEDMLDIRYSDWLVSSRNHLKQLSKDNDPIFIGGFSLGGVIASILTLENPDIEGLVLISPAFHSTLNHLLRWSWAYKRVQPWMFGTKLIEDNPTKYNSIPINSGDQYYRTTRYLKNRWNNSKIDIPTLMVLTSNDSVVDTDYTRSLFKHRFIDEHSQLIIYTDNQTDLATSRETLRNSSFIDRRILNQSHLSLINKPGNPLMGEDGTQLICNGNQPEVFFGCLRAQGHWFGAQHTPSPDGISVARTTYNPDFSFVVERIRSIFAR